MRSSTRRTAPYAPPAQPADRRLFAKYFLAFAAAVSIALLASGASEFYFEWGDLKRRVEDEHRERASTTASIIDEKIAEIERALGGLTSVPAGSAATKRELLRFMCVRLLRQVPAISDVAIFDSDGAELAFVSRLLPDSAGSGIDFAAERGFHAARVGHAWFSPVYFYRQTEPYLTLVSKQRSIEDHFVRVSVNLAFMRDVVSQLPFGVSDRQYVVDSAGQLIADPDMKWVLNKTNLSTLPQVALALRGGDDDGRAQRADARTFVDLEGRRVVAAHARIAAVGWFAFSEEAASHAYAPLYSVSRRSATLLLLGFLLALGASAYLLRQILAPVTALRNAAERFGNGKLDERLHLRTGDELQVLAEAFNRMAAQIQASQANLEREIARRTVALERANQAKSRFLAIASHELSQPMHALGLFVAALRARSTSDITPIVSVIERTVDAMKLLIDALLDISKLDSVAPPEVRAGDLALRPFIERLRPEFAIAAQAKGLDLRVRLRDVVVRSDGMLLERVVRNLVANAIRYTRAGGILIASRRRGDKVLLEVYDTGPGIAADRIELIFEEFYRVEEPGLAQESGLGLGLAIVRRLCAQLGHEVRVRSRPGRGSAFSIVMAPDGTQSPPADR